MGVGYFGARCFGCWLLFVFVLIHSVILEITRSYHKAPHSLFPVITLLMAIMPPLASCHTVSFVPADYAWLLLSHQFRPSSHRQLKVLVISIVLCLVEQCGRCRTPDSNNEFVNEGRRRARRSSSVYSTTGEVCSSPEICSRPEHFQIAARAEIFQARSLSTVGIADHTVHCSFSLFACWRRQFIDLSAGVFQVFCSYQFTPSCCCCQNINSSGDVDNFALSRNAMALLFSQFRLLIMLPASRRHDVTASRSPSGSDRRSRTAHIFTIPVSRLFTPAQLPAVLMRSVLRRFIFTRR